MENHAVMQSIRLRRRIVLVCSLVVLTTVRCSDEPLAPPRVPGQFTLVVMSPNDDDGAALVELDGAGVTSVGADSAEVLTDMRDGRLRVVVARRSPGPLVLTLAVRDTAADLDAVLLEVADAADAPRSSLAGYTIEIRK
jgi:hypothetical protein